MGKSRTRGWKKCGCYVWRTRKPHAVAGLPLIGRHTAYVGQTNNRYYRDNQHRYGDGRYGSVSKSWMDLDPKVYSLPCLFPHVKRCREWQEKIYIRCLWPVYNVEWNKGNPRRIAPGRAQTQRWARDKSRFRFNVIPAVARGTLALIVFAGLLWTGLEKAT